MMDDARQGVGANTGRAGLGRIPNGFETAAHVFEDSHGNQKPRTHPLACRPHHHMDDVTVPLCHNDPRQGHRRAELQPPVETRDVWIKYA
jgi:hypothetical protein